MKTTFALICYMLTFFTLAAQDIVITSHHESLHLQTGHSRGFRSINNLKNIGLVKTPFMSEKLLKILNKKYEEPGRLDMKFRNNDVTLIIDKHGDAVTMFIGKRKANGNISGERYTRHFKRTEGVENSHWDRKGKI